MADLKEITNGQAAKQPIIPSALGDSGKRAPRSASDMRKRSIGRCRSAPRVGPNAGNPDSRRQACSHAQGVFVWKQREHHDGQAQAARTRDRQRTPVPKCGGKWDRGSNARGRGRSHAHSITVKSRLGFRPAENVVKPCTQPRMRRLDVKRERRSPRRCCLPGDPKPGQNCRNGRGGLKHAHGALTKRLPPTREV